MRMGGGKAKGASFERQVCKALSLWVSHGEREDCFWRSAMSGGRATVRGRSGIELARQAGDITATSSEGLLLTERFYIECKHHAKMGVDRFIVGTGKLIKFWQQTCNQALHYDRAPMLIARSNGYPILVLVRQGSLGMVCAAPVVASIQPIACTAADVFLFDSMLLHDFVPMRRERLRIKR